MIENLGDREAGNPKVPGPYPVFPAELTGTVPYLKESIGTWWVRLDHDHISVCVGSRRPCCMVTVL